MTSPVIDPIYFSDEDWSTRRKKWIDEKTNKKGDPFEGAHVDVIIRTLESEGLSARPVVNIGADSLLKFLAHGKYRNCYEIKNKPIPGEDPDTVRISTTRREVDALIGFGGSKAETLYFGAVELSGTGVRFYGEYCMVLNNNVQSRIEQVLDRNSYDLERAPLQNARSVNQKLPEFLKGKWSDHLVDILILKVIPRVSVLNRLATPGTIAEAVLTDEDFVEVHFNATFGPPDLDEVRLAPGDEALSSDLRTRWRRGLAPDLSEWLWLWRRQLLDVELSHKGISRRVVTTSGRSSRWS